DVRRDARGVGLERNAVVVGIAGEGQRVLRVVRIGGAGAVEHEILSDAYCIGTAWNHGWRVVDGRDINGHGSRRRVDNAVVDLVGERIDAGEVLVRHVDE